MISRYFHSRIRLPSSAMLMEKRLIFCIIIGEGDSNMDGFNLALSQEAAEQEAGIKKTSFHKYVNLMIEKGYLVPRKENSNIFDFYEIPKREEDKRAVPACELKSLPHELSSLPDEQNSLQGGLTGSQPNKEIYNKDKIYNINQIIKDSTQDGIFVF